MIILIKADFIQCLLLGWRTNTQSETCSIASQWIAPTHKHVTHTHVCTCAHTRTPTPTHRFPWIWVNLLTLSMHVSSYLFLSALLEWVAINYLNFLLLFILSRTTHAAKFTSYTTLCCFLSNLQWASSQDNWNTHTPISWF